MGFWAWSSFIYVGIFVLINVVFTIVCAVGGFFDLIKFFKDLATSDIDERDDGRVE